jgi:hypothetical protein
MIDVVGRCSLGVEAARLRSSMARSFPNGFERCQFAPPLPAPYRHRDTQSLASAGMRQHVLRGQADLDPTTVLVLLRLFLVSSCHPTLGRLKRGHFLAPLDEQEAN